MPRPPFCVKATTLPVATVVKEPSARMRDTVTVHDGLLPHLHLADGEGELV